MKFRDLKDMDREDILGALGLQSKPTAVSMVLGTLGIFGVGLVVGASMALLFAPKPGHELRRDIGHRLRRAAEEEPGNGRGVESSV